MALRGDIQYIIDGGIQVDVQAHHTDVIEWPSQINTPPSIIVSPYKVVYLLWLMFNTKLVESGA